MFHQAHTLQQEMWQPHNTLTRVVPLLINHYTNMSAIWYHSAGKRDRDPNSPPCSMLEVIITDHYVDFLFQNLLKLK